MRKKSKTPILDTFRTIYIRRPQLPQIAKYIDREFGVIYVNVDAHPLAKIVRLK